MSSIKKKNNVLNSEDIVQINYKQVSKLKHLTEESNQLKEFILTLKQFNQKSKNILQSIRENSNSSKLNSTACSIGNIIEPGFPIDQTQSLYRDINELKIKMQQKKKQLYDRIQQSQKNKKQEQLFYRKILYTYEQKLSQLKNTVLNRESYIQKIEKNKKQNKPIIVESKCLLINQSSIELLELYANEKFKFIKATQQAISLKLEINSIINQIKKFQKIGLKFKLAKQTNMPYYKFKDILQNGIERMTQSDLKEYAYLNKLNSQMPKPTEKIFPQITNQSLYLILQKQKLNKEFLLKRIAQQSQKQNELKQKNNRLKQALAQKEQIQLYRNLQNLINNQRDYFKQSKWKSYSEVGGHVRQHIKIECNLQQYRVYLETLKKQFKKKIPNIFNLKNKVKKLSKSLPHTIKKWNEQDHRVFLDSSQVTLFNQSSFINKCHDFITDRFYQDQDEVDI